MIADDDGSNGAGAEDGNVSNMTLDDSLREAGVNAVEEAIRRIMERQQPIPGPVGQDQGTPTSKSTGGRGAQPPPGAEKRPAADHDVRGNAKRKSTDDVGGGGDGQMSPYMALGAAGRPEGYSRAMINCLGIMGCIELKVTQSVIPYISKCT